MIPFWHKSERMGGKWIVEQRDVKRLVLLADGVEHILQPCDVGMLYVVDNANGDRLEVAPHEDNDDASDGIAA